MKLEGESLGLSIPLVEPDEMDAVRAKDAKFRPRLGDAFRSAGTDDLPYARDKLPASLDYAILPLRARAAD